MDFWFRNWIMIVDLDFEYGYRFDFGIGFKIFNYYEIWFGVWI